VVATDRSLDNGLVRVAVADDGTAVVESAGSRLEGVGRIVDGGDYGDTYNFGPPVLDRLVDRPTSVAVRALDAGPVRGSLEIVAGYDWPAGLDQDGPARSDATEPVAFTTRLEVRADEPFVRVAIRFDNPSRDHRVRYHVPLAAGTDHSSAEGQFAVVDRGLTAEAGHGEVATPTFPAHGFVHAAGLTVLLEHVTEYELVDGRELALTVLRSTGLISRNDNPYREDPAGPEVPVPGAQLLGEWRFGFALLPHAGSWRDADALRALDRFRLPAVTAFGRGPTDAPAETTPGLRIDGDGVVLSALRRSDDELELRLVAETREATTATIELPAPITRARDVDLLGRPLGEIPVGPDGGLRVAMAPWEIRTVRVRRGAR
jgi:alpha-mannosidase